MLLWRPVPVLEIVLPPLLAFVLWLLRVKVDLRVTATIVAVVPWPFAAGRVVSRVELAGILDVPVVLPDYCRCTSGWLFLFYVHLVDPFAGTIARLIIADIALGAIVVNIVVIVDVVIAVGVRCSSHRRFLPTIVALLSRVCLPRLLLTGFCIQYSVSLLVFFARNTFEESYCTST